ncbi:DNA-binding LacI/PurR family transcriptional regulator [Nocardiopsis arvandica]|uniref:DNA-binding LacI/PurR family transcriptional regulator n=2 Tax=Nocardiopsis sinuspersici TaxID=501010 RepID=A0A7Y9XJ29_9ACTN|nr:DNA-binding LacI/PurR family transcriptional regulator [Nocardiopsis sinuspersici]
MPESDAGARSARHPTMADVAAHVGVSRQLVSLVLGERPGPSARTRERVLRAAEELGYQADTAARLLRRARSRQVGVLFGMGYPMDAHLVEALYPATAELGYGVVLSAMASTRSEREAIGELMGLRCEALLLIGLSAEAPADLARVAERVPVVEIGQRTGAEGTDSVRTADAVGVRRAVEHLVGLGHRAIVHVDGGGLPGADERVRGYAETMRGHGLGDRVEVLPGDYSEEAGARAARRLLARDSLPTAVVAANDLCAFGLVATLVRAGVSVPGDVSVVGYDDSRTAQLSFLRLTSVRQDAEHMARLAVRSAAERLDGGRTRSRHLLLEPSLTVRDSTAPPR